MSHKLINGKESFKIDPEKVAQIKANKPEGVNRSKEIEEVKTFIPMKPYGETANVIRNSFDYKGIHQNGTPYDNRGFNVRGIHQNGTKWNDKGFDYKRIHQNGTPYDNRGFNERGFDKQGFDKNGFDKEGWHRNNSLYDEKGFDANGLNKRRFNRDFLYEGKGLYDKEGLDYFNFDKNGNYKGGLEKKDEEGLTREDRLKQYNPVVRKMFE